MKNITVPIKAFGQLEEMVSLAEEAMLGLQIPHCAVLPYTKIDNLCIIHTSFSWR